jgi:hypothetical protein
MATLILIPEAHAFLALDVRIFIFEASFSSYFFIDALAPLMPLHPLF